MEKGRPCEGVKRLSMDFARLSLIGPLGSSLWLRSLTKKSRMEIIIRNLRDIESSLNSE